MRDRFGNWVHVTYSYSGLRETGWSVDDSTGRHHTVTLQNYPTMNDGWSRGQMVSQLDLQGYAGGRAPYSLCYNTDCSYNPSTSGPPALTELRLPDSTKYTFANGAMANALSHIRYPTGATVDYTYASYTLPAQNDICSLPPAWPSVATRTVRDGSTARTWTYMQRFGSMVPAQQLITDACHTGDNFVDGPIYWSRTSVVEPENNGKRARTDHYFSVFPDGIGPFEDQGFTLNNPLPGMDVQKYGHSGAIGAPPLSARRGLEPAGFPNNDADASDDPAHPDTLRLLATESFADCDTIGDCTNGTLLRTTYDRYTGSVSPKPVQGRAIDTAQLISTRTVFADGRYPQTSPPATDTPCGAQPCHTQTTYTDDNGASQFRTTTTSSNFPLAQTVVVTTQYPSWTPGDLVDMNRKWFLDIYSEKTRSEAGATAREQFCFDGNTAALLRHRVLAGDGPGSNDVLNVFSYKTNGEMQFASDYGGDGQTLDTLSPLCSMPLPSQPVYKVENTYTAGILATSRYYNPTNNLPLGFLSLDRSIDASSGAITSTRDTAGVQTSYGYTALPARLESMTDPSGTVTTYAYTNATGAADSTMTPAKVAATTSRAGVTDTLQAEFMFDGMGRVQRESHRQPNQWSATETGYDEESRVAWKSQPESTGSSPASGPLQAAHKTLFTYDPFGRTTSVTTPDNKSTTFSYSGTRLRRKTAGIRLTAGETAVTTLETYDQNGRVVAITEGEGTGLQVTTNYGFDVGNRLASVSMGGTQSRTFFYDRRGFLNWELHPELGANGGGTTRYYNYDPRGHAGRKVTGPDNGLFDLTLSYDFAERMVSATDYGATHRPLKSFVYATDNDPFGSDLRNGKLLTATRYNHLTTGDFTVSETYQYVGAAGRPSQRDTLVQSSNGTTVQMFTQTYHYDPFGAVAQIDYPFCNNGITCGGNPPASVPFTRSRGVLTGVGSYASLNYNVDGSLHQVVHGTTSPITDSYEPDDSGMTRPGMITFSGFQSCTAPTAAVGSGGTIQPGGSFDIPVTLTGASPWSITWSDGFVQSGLTTTSFSRHVTPSATTTYFITAISDANCAGTSTGSATVTVSCTQPTASVSGGGTVTPGSSAQVQATLTGTGPWSLTWSDGFQQTVSASPVVRTVTPAQTTIYTINSISDAHCSGSSSGSATVTVRLVQPTGFSATTITSNSSQVAVAWNAVSGATWYQVERAPVVTGPYSPVGGRITVTSVVHTLGDSVPTTYLYRVVAGATFAGVDTYSPASGSDYATVAPTLFTNDPIAAGSTAIKGIHIGELRKAIDAMRLAANLPAAWSNYGPATGVVTAADNVVARQKLDEAVAILAGHYVSYSGQTPAINGQIWAYQLQQIREGVK
jgi:YD repeat-containing protein